MDYAPSLSKRRHDGKWQVEVRGEGWRDVPSREHADAIAVALVYVNEVYHGTTLNIEQLQCRLTETLELARQALGSDADIVAKVELALKHLRSKQKMPPE